jgi:NDP-sugar pyrophosphorylase family protein
MQAVILAGGKGARLKPYTTVFPKPLMPVGDLPILEVVIRQLKRRGFTEIIMAVGHLKELIQAFFQDGVAWGVDIRYSYEDKPLGTAGPLKLIENLEDRFLVMNGDILTNLDFRGFFEGHAKSDAICTIASYPKPVKIDLGVLETEGSNRVIHYTEKPVLRYDVSMGIYAFDKRVIDFIPDRTYFDFPSLILRLIENRQTVRTHPFDGLWLDIGRPEDYEEAVRTFEANRSLFLE